MERIATKKSSEIGEDEWREKKEEKSEESPMEFPSIAENVKMTLEKSKQQTSIQNNRANIAMS